MIGLLVIALAVAVEPQAVLTIDPKHRIVEGVASDGRTIWVSSILDRQILACTSRCRTIATLPAGLYPFAIAWDGAQKRLWVAADCPPGIAQIKECDRGALIALDRRGRTTAVATLPNGKFHPGDVSVSPAGIFASDSQNGAIYRLGSAGSLAPLLAPGEGKSAQGTALDETGQRLIVADYSQGVGAVDLATGRRIVLKREDGKPLRGIDGLVRCGPTYFGIYNGSAPGRLVSFAIGSGQFRDQLILDDPAPSDTMADPTQVAFDGTRVLVVADSGWSSIDKPDFVRIQGATVVAFPQPFDCVIE